MFYKDIICLANSRKLNGRCVAGKDTKNYKWIRPVSPLSKTGELILRDITYEDWAEAKVLDIIRIPFKNLNPTYYQPENAIMSKGIWEKIGIYDKTSLDCLCDKPENILMYGDEQNRISVEVLKNIKIPSSLLFIKPEQVILINEKLFGKHKLNCCFNFNNVWYNLRVTDLKYEKIYKNKPTGKYKAQSSNIYLCVSLSEPYNGYCYKLVATILVT